MSTLTTRKPTGAVVAPLVLLEGGEKAGKSYAAALLSTSDKVGRVLWLDLGEGAGDEYAAIAGTRYEVIEHDGSYRSIFEQVCAARDEAARAQQAGELPVVLVIDSMTHLWEMLKEWVDGRARRREKNRKLLAQDPNAEIDITTDLWNDATGRWRQVMTKLMTFPGPVVMTARGKEVVEIGADGKPTRNSAYKVEGQKSLAHDASVWVRMTREDGASVIGARSVHLGIRPGQKPQKLGDDWTLEWLIFEALKYEQGPVRDLKPTGSAVEQRADAEDIREEALTTGRTRDELAALYQRASAAGLLEQQVTDGAGKATTLRDLIVARGNAAGGQSTAAAEQPASPAPADPPSETPAAPSGQSPPAGGPGPDDLRKTVKTIAKAKGTSYEVLAGLYLKATARDLDMEGEAARIEQFIAALHGGRVQIPAREPAGASS